MELKLWLEPPGKLVMGVDYVLHTVTDAIIEPKGILSSGIYINSGKNTLSLKGNAINVLLCS